MRKPCALAIVLAALGCGGGSKGGGTPTPAAYARRVLATGVDGPMQYVANPARPGVAYLLERGGRVRALVGDALASAPVLDVSGTVTTEGEGGLLGMALAPDFATSRAFYLYSVVPSPLRSRITRYTMNADMVSASAAGTTVFEVDQPYTNHKGGTIRFGTDGMLYVGLGDGGSGNDPQNRAQDGTSLLGKILRIDPAGDDFPLDAAQNYRVPSDNPFVGTAGVRGEIWDVGVRNPFRWSIDSATGAHVYADVGQDAYEEVDYEPAGVGGRNYGWRVREGLHATSNGGTTFSGAFTDPFLEYDHGVGHSITGGFVYHGSALGSGNAGRYLFADYVSDHLWAAPLAVSGGTAAPTTVAESINLAVSGGWDGIVSIDPDKDGEPIVVELNAGRVSRLVPAP